MEEKSKETGDARPNYLKTTSMYPKELGEIVYYAWNNEFDKAYEAAGDLKNIYPRHANLCAGISASKAWISSASEQKNEALSAYKAAEDLATSFIKSDEKLNQLTMKMTGKIDVDPVIKWNWLIDCKLVVADCLLNRAIFQMTMGIVVKVAYNMRKSWKMFEKIKRDIAEKQKENIKVEECIENELKFSLGLFYFFVSFAPGMFLKVLELLGFVANRELGIQYMNEMIDKETMKETNAAVFLLLNYLVIPRGLTKKEENLNSADKILVQMLIKYPKCSFLLMMASQLEMKKGNIKQAQHYAQVAIDSISNLPVVPNNYNANLAGTYYVARDWKAAANMLEKICNGNSQDFEMKGMSGIQLATCYHMMGEDGKCEEVLQRIPTMITKASRFDKLAEKKLVQFRNRGITLGVFEFMYIRRDLHHLKMEDLKAIQEILEQQYKKTIPNTESKMVYLLIKAVILTNLEDVEQAKTCLKEIISNAKQVKNDVWIMPNAYQELGEIYYFEKNEDGAEEMFKAAYKYKDYDFEDVVRNRIKLSLDTIQKEKSTPKEKKEKKKSKS